MFSIIDTNHDVTPRLAQLKASGITSIGRYISIGMTAKVIRIPEAKAIAAAGMKLFLIYETDGKPSGGAVGARDGKFALDYAKSLGAPNGACIYYTADFDAMAADMPGLSTAYSAFRSAVSPTFRVGGYANGYALNRLYAAKLIDIRWLTCSTGFNGTRDAIKSGAYDILQLQPQPVAGLDTDPDTLHIANGDIGDFVPFAKPVIVPPPDVMPVAAKSTESEGFFTSILRSVGIKP